jgi:hypothetical protein
VSRIVRASLQLSSWTFRMPLTTMNSKAIKAYECHAGNIGLKDTLEIAHEHDSDVR